MCSAKRSRLACSWAAHQYAMTEAPLAAAVPTTARTDLLRRMKERAKRAGDGARHCAVADRFARELAVHGGDELIAVAWAQRGCSIGDGEILGLRDGDRHSGHNPRTCAESTPAHRMQSVVFLRFGKIWPCGL